MNYATTRALIFTDNLRHNLNEIKSKLNKNTKMCVAVKADGYGNGAIETARECEALGVDMLAIARVSEGEELRQAGIKLPLILLSLCSPEEFPLLFENEIIPFVFGKDHILLMAESYKNWSKNHNSSEKFDVHLAIDTGMGRVGCRKEEACEEAKVIESTNCLHLAGMGTHFALSDNVEESGIEYTREQFLNFKEAVENVKNAGINPGICHAGASAVAINNPEFHFDMVRPGIIVYGYYPDQVTKEFLFSKGISLDLKPVMQFETRVSAIRHFTPGQSVSYGRTWICEKETNIAVLPVGYADGLLRRYNPGLMVAINGKNYSVVGRICMDQCMVDIGFDNKDVKTWDRAVIFGPDNGEALQSAETLAHLGNTISYEVMTSISKRVPRVLL